MNNYEIVECLKCDNRFILYDHQDEHIVCKHCDNQDREETIFLSLNTFSLKTFNPLPKSYIFLLRTIENNKLKINAFDVY